jgi:hypothetical protein
MRKIDLSGILIFLFLIVAFFLVWQSSPTKSEYNLPKVIWQYWDKELPPMIQMIKDNNQKKLQGWTIHYLNENTVATYIPPFEFPPGYSKLGEAHKADWLRLYLLKKYGGVWMDASIIINDPNAIDRLHTQSIQQESELTLFQFKTPLNVENWFIMAPEKSRMIETWFTEYDSAIRMGFPHYKKMLWKDGVNTSCGKKDDKIEDVYFTQHSCIQRILQKGIVRNPNIIVNKAEETMLKVDFLCDNKKEAETKECLIKQYSDFKSLRQLPYIKINGGNRKLPVDWKQYLETN